VRPAGGRTGGRTGSRACRVSGPPGGSAGRRANRALLAGLAVLAAGTWALAAGDRQLPREPGGALEERLAAGAWALCRRVVAERLGTPPAARFPWFDPRAVERVSDSVRVVRASVDARDPAGGPARVAVTCRARWLGGDRWLDDGTVVRPP
jgi:hypothetical protein